MFTHIQIGFLSEALTYARAARIWGEQKHSTKCKMLLFYLLGVDDITIHVHAMTLHCFKRFLYHVGKEGTFPVARNTLQPQFHLAGGGVGRRFKISQTFLSSPKFTTKKRRKNYWTHIPTCNDMQPFNQKRKREGKRETSQRRVTGPLHILREDRITQRAAEGKPHPWAIINLSESLSEL